MLPKWLKSRGVLFLAAVLSLALVVIAVSLQSIQRVFALRRIAAAGWGVILVFDDKGEKREVLAKASLWDVIRARKYRVWGLFAPVTADEIDVLRHPSLNLSVNLDGVTLGEGWGSQLGGIRNIEEFFVRNTAVDVGEFDRFCRATSARRIFLVGVDSYPINDAHIRSLVNARNLRSFGASSAGAVTDQSVDCLARLSLESLKLRSSSLTDAGFVRLAAAPIYQLQVDGPLITRVGRDRADRTHSAQAGKR